MQLSELLTSGKFYHIYNRGINSCDLFRDDFNYDFFLGLYDKHISPVADTFAWVLMKNHFHFLVKIKEKKDFSNPKGFGNLEGLGTKLPYQSFSNLFNSYTKAFNKKYRRTGSLFEHPFKRKMIEDKEVFKKVIIYIHNNPVHHGFSKFAIEYQWSSYRNRISDSPTLLPRKVIIRLFDGLDNFKTSHDGYINDIEMEQWFGI